MAKYIYRHPASLLPSQLPQPKDHHPKETAPANLPPPSIALVQPLYIYEQVITEADEILVIKPPPNHPIRPLISTDVKPSRYSLETATPMAQDLQDLLAGDSRLRSGSTSSLESRCFAYFSMSPHQCSLITEIDEQAEADGDDNEEPFPQAPQVADEIGDLRTLLHESWTLCNTLANLSSMLKPRVFRDLGTLDAVERAWRACWKLCHRLYDNQDEDPAYLRVGRNLDLCRDFCQALFDVREKKDVLADSVLRVSFELNNQ